MNPVLAKVLKKTFATSATVVGALFVVYFWKLEMEERLQECRVRSRMPSSA